MIWSTELSDKLQVVSLVLESLGLGLAFFQFTAKDKARSVEAQLIEFSNSSFLLKDGRVYKNGLISIIALTLMLIYAKELAAITNEFLMVLGGIYVLAFIGNSLFFIIVVLNKLSKNRAIGGLGLLLAFLGVCGEVYQVLTMYFTEGLPIF